MSPKICGYYATRVYLPLSAFSRNWRRFSRRIRGKSGPFLQSTQLPTISWRSCTGVSVPRVSELRKANGNVRVSELAILSALSEGCPEGSTLFEIGTFDGRTTLNLAFTAPSGCRIYTLDLPPDQATRYGIERGERHMVEKPAPGARYEQHRAAYPQKIGRIHQLLGDSASFDYTAYEKSCALVFVDGSHAYEYAKSDTEVAMRLVSDGGVIVWHDYGVWAGVTKALEEIEQRDRLGLRHIRGTSLVLWRKVKSEIGARANGTRECLRAESRSG